MCSAHDSTCPAHLHKHQTETLRLWNEYPSLPPKKHPETLSAAVASLSRLCPAVETTKLALRVPSSLQAARRQISYPPPNMLPNSNILLVTYGDQPAKACEVLLIPNFYLFSGCFCWICCWEMPTGFLARLWGGGVTLTTSSMLTGVPSRSDHYYCASTPTVLKVLATMW